MASTTLSHEALGQVTPQQKYTGEAEQIKEWRKKVEGENT